MSRTAITSRAAITEKQNLVTYSEDISAYTKTNLSTVANSTTNPFDGTTTANTLTDDATSGLHRAYMNSLALVPFQNTTLSAAFKNVSRRYAGIYADTGPGSCHVIADLQNGTISSTSSAPSNVVSVTGGIETFPDYAGWYRVYMTFISKTNATIFSQVILSNNGTSTSYSGNGSSVYFVGLQLVRANWAGPYQKTTGSAVNTGTIRNKVLSRASVSSRGVVT